MILDTVLFLLGLIILYYGAEWLIRGASGIALDYGIRPVVVGLTIVALGTSMPEFLVNFIAALGGEHDLALGNIIGSNISNIALILGASALVLPIAVTPQILQKEYPMMLGAMVVFYGVALDGTISRLDGGLLVTCLIAFIGYLLYDAQNNSAASSMIDEIDVDDDSLETSSPQDTLLKKTLFLVGGTIGLAVGAHFMVDSAVDIANVMGISQITIGLTIVAIGTSLPELAASMVGAIKDEADLSVGNILGSNLLNVLFVVGTVSIMSPLSVEPTTQTVHFPVMLGICVMLLPIAWTRFQITRLEGGVLLATFLSYMTYIVVWTV
ncbi:sodium:proton exchanger [Longibacter salinarum]|uniref:Sodium:proton exchanger n=1 Tax=Longibacter salinarum TaxID=1850348 RepID=A0A2A8D1V0_9BACT|nr:calcium/sodium antiporter [Longibacter salinarum]PEN14942.1 sodium:proton exchanger [Longibacter salinarum]